uniref:Transcriptional regulator n=1 Tax=Tolypothrix bouteillei VB521301 TaxID=1479485 RepID=A0A0C1NM68_9CYAN
MRILLVEDDNLLAQSVAAYLREQRYLVDIAVDGQDGWELAAVCNYDLILLDVILPKIDGISLCRQLRQDGYQMPILLLTAKDTKTDKVMGLDAGADDYLVKPFDFQELAARIRALLRRGNSSLPPILEWENLRLDPSSCEVSYASEALHLTSKEFSILELFLRNSQRVFSRSAIIDKLWSANEDPPAENTIKSHIKSLRQKLKAAGASYDFIETVYGLGYRLKPLSHEQTSHTSEKESNWIQQQALLAAFDKARENFKIKVAERIAVLEQATNALRKGFLDVQLRQNAREEAHKLAGSLGSFGFANGSHLAYEVEHLLEGEALIDRVQALYLYELVMKMQQEIEQNSVEPSFDEPLPTEQCQNVLLVVSGDRPVVEPLAKEAAYFNLQVKTATDTVNAKRALDNAQTFDETSEGFYAVILDLCGSHNVRESLELVAELSNQTPPVPVLVFVDRSDFTNRIEVARAGGSGFLDKSMSPKQVLEQVIQLQRPSVTQAKVMIVDDDPHVVTLIQKLLEPMGLKLATLCDPQHFWEILTKFSPDLLLLDVKMPNINGIELCQVVRNDPHWCKLPVLFLTAHTEAETVEQIFAAGADDCVSKPIVGAQLVTRILNRLQRTELLGN